MPSGQLTIVGAVVALVVIVAAAVVAVTLTGHLDATSTPLLVSLLGVVAPTIVALLALLKLEHTGAKVDKLVDVANGHASGDVQTRAGDRTGDA